MKEIVPDNDRYDDPALNLVMATADQKMKRVLLIQGRIDELKMRMAASALTNVELSELIDLTAEAQALREWMIAFEGERLR